MKLRVICTFLCPALFFGISAAVSEAGAGTWLGGVGSALVRFLMLWPLDLLAVTGFVEPGDEGFYGRWTGASLAVSLGILGLAALAAMAGVLRGKTPNNSFKPKPLRGSA